MLIEGERDFFMRILHCIMTSERKESFFLLTERIFETSRVTVFFTLTCRHKSLSLFHALLLKLISLIILPQSMRYQILNCLTLNINLKLNLCEREKVFISGSIYRCFSNENLHMTQVVLKCIY